MATRRRERINQVIRRIIAKKIIEDVKDPRVGFTTVTRVEVKDDLTHADVFFSVIGTEKEKKSTLKILNHMSGYLQKDLGPALRTRVTPRLSFHYDSDTEQAVKMSNLIDKARAGDTDKNAIENDLSEEIAPEHQQEVQDGDVDKQPLEDNSSKETDSDHQEDDTNL